MINKLIASTLRMLADKLDRGECDITSEEAEEIMAAICHTPLSKDQACSHLGISRATFDNYVRDCKFPQGRKRKGFKELVWYQDELDNSLKFFS